MDQVTQHREQGPVVRGQRLGATGQGTPARILPRRPAPGLLPPTPGPWPLLPPLLVCLAMGWFPPFSVQAAEERLEYQVKAVFLLNFTKFIEWPPAAFVESDSPIEICVLGDDPFGSTLDQAVAGEVVNGRKVAVQRIKGAPSPKTCQVLFLGRPEKDVLQMLRGLGPGVLTIGEGESFVHDGGMIGFVIENRRVRFGINQTAAENAGLKLSSRLLSVARSVEK